MELGLYRLAASRIYRVVANCTHEHVFVSVWTEFDPAEVSYKELHELHMLVTQTMKQPSIVVDADELLKNPGIRISLFNNYIKVQRCNCY